MPVGGQHSSATGAGRSTGPGNRAAGASGGRRDRQQERTYGEWGDLSEREREVVQGYREGDLGTAEINESLGFGDYMGVDTSDDKFASKVQGRLARERFDDYMDRFAPVVRDLSDRALGDEGLQSGLADADEAVSSSFESARGQSERRRDRYGVNQSAGQREATERSSALAEAKANVGARNNVRRTERDRRLRIMAGGGLSSVAGQQTG